VFRLKSDFTKSTLFSGDETELKNRVFHATAHHVSLQFNLSELKPFLPDSIQQYISPDLLEQLLAKTGFKKGRGVLGHYVNASKLTVYFIPFSDERQQTNHLLMVAFGELSAGHFVLEQEALLENTD
jgi:hypothetical protein